MPTLILADNFSHRAVTTNRHNLGSANGERGAWSVVASPAQFTYDETKTRDSRGYLKVVETTAITRIGKGIAAGCRTFVGSAIIRIEAAPSVESLIWHTPGSTGRMALYMTTGGNLKMQCGTIVTTAGTYADDTDHRIDFYYDTTTTTFTVAWAVDGSPQTQCSATGQTAIDTTTLYIGTDQTVHTLTFWVQDLALSATAGDHPINTIFVRDLNPNGDGTHNISGAGDFDKGDGTDILVSTSDAWGEIDDWINAAADDVTYIQATAAASTEYTEHTLDNVTPLETTIYDVFGYTATLANAATTATLTVRVVDSTGATLTDILANEDVSDTTSHFNVAKIAAPGGTWDQAELNGLKVRIGLSTVVTNLPRCSAVHVQYVTPDVGGFPIEGASFPGRRSFVG